MKLEPDEIAELGEAVAKIIRRRQRSAQRLVPLHEAQSILEAVQHIRARADSAETMLNRHELPSAKMDLHG